MEHAVEQGRSLAETPTYSVASVVTVMVFVCFLVERSIYRFGKVDKNIQTHFTEIIDSVNVWYHGGLDKIAVAWRFYQIPNKLSLTLV